MSQENMEIVRRLFEAVGRGDIEDVIGCAAEDGVIDASRRLLGGRSFVGHQGIREYFAMLDDVWSNIRTEPEDFIPAGDAVVVPVRVVNTGRASDITVGAQAAWVAEVRDRQVARMTVYQSRAEALEAAGMSE